MQKEPEDTAPEQEICELRLNLLRDKIASQANIFDQIDSKTGVALGFVFIVIGQVLAAIFRIATDHVQLHLNHPVVVATAFVVASTLAFSGIITGTVSRWPRDFESSVVMSQKRMNGPYCTTLSSICDILENNTAVNKRSIECKGSWATATYLLLSLSILAYLILAVFLYWNSVPTK